MQNEKTYLQILVKRKYITASAAIDAFYEYREKKQEGYTGSLSDYFLDKGLLTRYQHNRAALILKKKLARKKGPPKKPQQDLKSFGHFEILGQVAVGGMGIVYRARHRDSSEIVALKLLHSFDEADASQLKRFRREADMAGKVKHENVVMVKEFGKHEAMYFLAMEFIEGKPLSDYPIRKINDCVEICLKICRGLQCIHKEGIVHRDIKPANILMDLTGNAPVPKITDFSLALMEDPLASRITKTGTTVGTPYYMSPEQAMGRKANIDLRSDIYSLGVVLYEMVTSRLPFQSNNLTDLYAQIMNEEPPDPSSLRKTVRRELDFILQRAMAKKPQFRYKNCREMAQDLEDYLAKKKPRHCTRSRIWERLRRKGVFKKTNILIAVLSLLLVGSSTAIGILLLVKSPNLVQSNLASEHLGKARTLLEQGSYDAALKKVALARMLSPDSRKVGEVEAEILKAMSAPAIQAQLMSEVHDLYEKGQRGKAWSRLQLLERTHWERTRALSLYERLESLDADDGRFWDCLQQLWKLPTAYFIAIREDSSGVRPAPAFRAIRALRLSNFKDASQILESCRKDSPLFLYLRGTVRLYLGNWENGREDLQRLATSLQNSARDDFPFCHLGSGNYAELCAYARSEPAENSETSVVQAAACVALVQDLGHWPPQARQGVFAALEKLRQHRIPAACLYKGILQRFLGQSEKAAYSFECARADGAPDFCVSYHQALGLPLDESISILEKIVAQIPDFTRANLQLGYIYLEKDRLADGAACFQKVLKSDISSVEAHCGRGLCLLRSRREKEGLTSLDKAIAIYHDRFGSPHGPFRKVAAAAARAYLWKGRSLQSRGEIPPALRQYRRSFYICPESREDALTSLFAHHLDRKNYYRSLWELYELNPAEIVSPARRKTVGSFHLEEIAKQAYLQVEKQLETIEKTDLTQMAQGKLKLGFVQFVLEDRKAAISSVRESLSLRPSPEGHWLHGEIRYHMGNHKNACDSYVAALQLCSDFYRARCGIVRCYRQLGQRPTDKSFQLLREQIEGVLARKSDCEYDDLFFQSVNDALETFLKIPEKNGDSTPLEFCGELLAFWEGLLDMNKSNAHHQRARGYMLCADGYASLGQNTKAGRLYVRAVRLSPNYPECYRRRGRFYRSTEQTEKADADFKMAEWLSEP